MRTPIPALAARLLTAVDTLSSRERLLVGVASALAMILVFSMGVWRPLAAWRERSLEDLRISDMVLARLGAAGGGRAIRVATGPGPDLAGSAAAAGVPIQSLEPDGDGVRVLIAAAPYARTIAWIAAVEDERPGRVASVKIERGAEPGLVDAEVLLAGAAP